MTTGGERSDGGVPMQLAQREPERAADGQQGREGEDQQDEADAPAERAHPYRARAGGTRR